MDQLKRAGELKEELVAFAASPRFKRRFVAFLADQCPDGVEDEMTYSAVVEEFLFRHRFADGETVVDKFVRSRRDLTEEDRGTLLGWKDLVQGIFEIRERDGDALVVVNLVDELTYRVRSNMGPEAIEPLPVGGFLVGNIAPVGDDWMMSGAHTAHGADEREAIRAFAAQTAARFPEKAFRNKEKLAKAWEIQAEQRDVFVELYGGDTIVVDGSELTDVVRALFQRHYESKGNDPADWTDPGFDFDYLSGESGVGVIFDLEDGLGFYPGFGMAREAFAKPELIVRREYREIVSGYLRDEDASPVPLRRLADAEPDNASRLFAKLLKKPSFSWETDGEALLRKHKPDYFANPPLPRTVPVGLDSVER